MLKVGAKSLVGFLVLAMLLTVNLSAQALDCCDIESRWLSRGCWRGDFDLLFWRPSGDIAPTAFTFAEVGNEAKSSGFFPISDYDVGYRAGIAYLSPCHPVYVGAWVTWINPKHTETFVPIAGNVMLSSFGDTIFAMKNSLSYRYITSDLEGGHRLASCGCLTADLFVAARYVDIECNLENIPSLVPPQTPTNQFSFWHLRLRFHGVGPRAGLVANWEFCRCLNLHLKLAGSCLYANRSNLSVQMQTEGVPITRGGGNNLNWCTFQFDMRLGLAYSRAICQWGSISIEGGLAMEQVIDQRAQVGFLVSPGPPAISRVPFSIGGPYLRIGITV